MGQGYHSVLVVHVSVLIDEGYYSVVVVFQVSVFIGKGYYIFAAFLFCFFVFCCCCSSLSVYW